MRKKIIGILVCTLLIATALSAAGAVNVNKNQLAKDEKNDGLGNDPVDICGTASVVLLGNDDGKIGAKVRFYQMIGPIVLIFRFVDIPVVLVDENYPNEEVRNRYFGEYACTMQGCGRYMAKALCPNDYCGNYTQNFELQNNNNIIVTIEIGNESCPRSRALSLQQPILQLFPRLLERLIDRFPNLF